MKLEIDIPYYVFDQIKRENTIKNVLNKVDFAVRNGVERPHGEWVSHYEYCKKHDCIPSGLIAFWWCNQCEQGVEIPTNFCPNCGADMKEGEAE